MYNLDEMPNRRNSDSVKWSVVSEGVLPMWVADMDIKTPQMIVDAVINRASHPYYGYPYTQDDLKPLIVAHYKKLYGADVDPEWIVWVPSVISGVVNALQMQNTPFIYSVPMYDHIRSLYKEAKLPVIEVPMKKSGNDHFEMDIDALEASVTDDVKSLILCNPHNPVGRVYNKDELLALKQFCKEHGLLVISDEIHCELDLEGRHIPYFTLDGEAASYSITLSSAGKICNIPGLPMGFAIIPNKELREKFSSRQDGLLPSSNVITLAAYEKAYDGSCDEWKTELRTYLKENRDIAEKRFNSIPRLHTPHNEGTYLLWVNCEALNLSDPAEFILENAKVKVSSGSVYGDPQCFRFNYGCPREQLIEALDRIEKAICARNENQ